MTIQLIAVRHHGSNILQCIFVSGGGPDTTYKFQATGFGKTTHRSLTKDEVLEHLRTWRDLSDEGGMLTVVQEDMLTMRRVAGCDFLEQVTGQAPCLDERPSQCSLTIGEAQAYFERTGHGLYGDADEREIILDTGRYESHYGEYDA